jgi:hypothetical protein
LNGEVEEKNKVVREEIMVLEDKQGQRRRRRRRRGKQMERELHFKVVVS